MKNDFVDFQKMRENNINKLAKIKKEEPSFEIVSEKLFQNQYTYNFNWLGLPIIQYPQDVIALQEIIWKTKPDIIIETGVARGGSIIFYSSVLHLLNGNGRVVGIDIDIRSHNKEAIENHPLSFRINLVEGSSIDLSTIKNVEALIKSTDKVMVILDSNHTHDHVLKELELYSPFVTKDCYLVVLDTCVEDLPDNLFDDRPWGKGNNPKTAVLEFLKSSNRFKIDESISNKLVLTSAPDGYLKCLK